MKYVRGSLRRFYEPVGDSQETVMEFGNASFVNRDYSKNIGLPMEFHFTEFNYLSTIVHIIHIVHIACVRVKYFHVSLTII